MTSAIIETTGLSKRYGQVAVVDDLSLVVPAGRISGFLGRNGAGKSTTIKMLLGMVRPTGGTGRIAGWRIDQAADSRSLRHHVAYVAEDKPVYPFMTVEQLIAFTRSFYADWNTGLERILLARYNLPPRQSIKALSKGMRSKLALLLALARRPALLILDEPSDGLDPVSIEELLQSLMSAAAEGTSVFFSSHRIDEVERIADSICIMDQGRLRLHQSMDVLRGRFRMITASFADTPPRVPPQTTGVAGVTTSGRQYRLLAEDNVDDLVAMAYATGAIAVDTQPVSLREIFLAMHVDATHSKIEAHA